MIGVPEELGGAVEQRSATTTVLMSESLAQGDMGIAVACLAPAAVSTAISLWGDAQQQATYLPAFVGDDIPAAALALMEPQPLFNPFPLTATARAAGGGYVLDGVKSLVPRASDAELFVIAATLDERRAGAVHRRVPDRRHLRRARAGHGRARGGTGRLILEDVRLPATALLGGDDIDVYKRVRRCSAAWRGARWPSAPGRRSWTT